VQDRIRSYQIVWIVLDRAPIHRTNPYSRGVSFDRGPRRRAILTYYPPLRSITNWGVLLHNENLDDFMGALII
jgi:hypothetical protein